MTYAYTGADLTSFTDRQNNTATFSYATGDYLQGITTPNSVQVLNNAYDSSGRLLSTADAFNKSIGYTHDINDHTETVTDRLGNSTTYLYDLDGNILQTTDALGHVTSSTYDSSDQKLTDTNALGKTSYYAYDSIGNMLTQTDPLGNITSYTYNALQEPLTITDPLGHVTTNGYDAHGNLTSTKDPAGNTTTSVYDTNGNVTSMTDAVNHTTTFFYDQFGHLATQTDALGNVTTNNYDVNGNRLSQSVTRTFQNAPQTLLTQFTYDNQSRLTQTIFPDNSSTQTHYNSLGQVDVRTDELGHQTQYQYDNDGHPTTTTYSDGTTDNTTYDANGNRTQTTNRGIVTSFVYDTVSRLTQTIAAPNTPNAATTTTNYDFAGQVTSTVDALGNATSYAYDDAGRRTSVTNALNQITAFTYDTAADQLTVKDARGNVTTNTYDNDNRLIKVTYPDARFESTAYDSLGRVQSRTDANGNATTYGYDALGRLTSVTDALSQVTSYGYDEVGNRITQTDANLHTTSYQYDQRGRRTSRALPLGQSEGYTYDTGGNLHARTDFNGKTTTYGYDSLNRLLTKTPDASFSAGPITFTYTPTGKRNTMADPSGTTIYGYDNRDRLTSKATPEGSLTYNYDAANNLTVLSTAGLSVSYTYGVLNRLSTVGESNTGSTAYAYDAAGNLSSFTTPNGVSHAYTYDPRNRLTNLAVGTTTTPLASYAYTLDNAGHRTAVTELGGRAVAYGYDNIYRLTSETVSGIPGAGAVAYTYDPVGNRKQTTSTLGTINPGLFNYDANDRLSTDTYDNNGNTITSIGATSTYDFENHLTGLGPNITMLYDGDGNRVKKTVNGVTTTYLVDDLSPTGYSQVVLETTGGETRQYVYGLERLSQRRVTNSAAETRYFGYDGHGSVRLLIDTTGTVTDTYDYDAFGNLINSTGLTPNNYRFAGEQFDFDLNLYYNRARYLNPATGRFWTMDSYEGITQEPKSLHKYLYVGADPLNSVDPTGKSVSSLIYGWRVHRFVQDDFEASGPGRLANRWLSTILEGQLDLAGNWRPDLTDKVTHEVYEIKPVGSEFAGALQLAGYIILLKVQDPQKNDWKPGTTYDPPPSLKLDPLTFAVISRSGLVPGIISYEVYNLVEIVNLVAWATRVVPVVEAAEANLTIGTAALAPI
jgi:RHS repeat-associated protein